MNNEKYISEIVANVIKSINAGGEVKPAQNGNHLKGVFSSILSIYVEICGMSKSIQKSSVLFKLSLLSSLVFQVLYKMLLCLLF